MWTAWRVVKEASRKTVKLFSRQREGSEGAGEKTGTKTKGEDKSGMGVEGVRMWVRTRTRVEAACGARRFSQGRQGSDR